MANYERSYGTARFVFAVLEVLGWAAAIVGVLAALSSFMFGGILGQLTGSGSTDMLVRLMTALPGLGVVTGGFAAIALAQIGRAQVDTADMTRELLAALKQGGPVETDARPVTASRPAPIAAAVEEPMPPAPPPVYRGVAIDERPDGYYVNGRRFPSDFDARAHIDGLSEPATTRRAQETAAFATVDVSEVTDELPEDPPAPVSSAPEIYRGVAIVPREGRFMIRGKPFPTMAEAKSFVDTTLDSRR